MNKADLSIEFIEGWRSKPFVWGESDCCMFVAEYVKKLTGVDHAVRWRGTYSTEVGALKALKEAGGMVALLSSALGDAQGPLSACRGDVVWGEYEEGPACGIMVGHACAFMAKDGVCLKPLSSIKGCWHV